MTGRCPWAVVLALGAVLGGLDAAAAQSTLQVAPPSQDAGPPSVEELAGWVEDERGLERVRIAIMARIAGLPSDEGTIWAQLLTVVEQVDVAAAPGAIRAVGMGTESGGLAGSDLLMEGLDRIPEADRAPLLALAAHLAATQDQARAAELRERLLREHPDALEATEARLLQAIWLLEGGERAEDGLQLLEELIVGSPRHPLAPEARRLYEANGGREGVDPGAGRL